MSGPAMHQVGAVYTVSCQVCVTKVDFASVGGWLAKSQQCTSALCGE